MFKLDTENIKRLGIYVAKPSGEIIGCLDEYIEELSASLKVCLSGQYELQFNLNYRPDDDTSLLEYLQEGMYLVVERVGLFRMKAPSTNELFNKRTVTVNAFSCECELEDKSTAILINAGTSDSMEYLVEYDADEEEPFENPYTGTPYDWIVLYNYFPEQLDILRQKFIDRHFGLQTSVEYVDIESPELIDEFMSYLNLIPRLKAKATYNEDGSYDIKPYISIEYNDDGTIRRIVVSVEFEERINELIAFYYKYRDQLSLLPLLLEKFGGSWTIGEIDGISNGDYSLANKKYQFEIGESVYSFLTQTFAKSSNCIPVFDRINRVIHIKKAESIGEETGIVLGYDTLVNSVAVSGTDDRFTTRIKVSGGDNLGIESVNFGRDTVVDISYKINAKTKNGDRIYVSDEFADKYKLYQDFVELKRSEYIESSKRYEGLLDEISDLKYKVPNDYLKTDWSTFTQEELQESLNSYNKQLSTLLTLYREDYGNAGFSSDGGINITTMKNSIYWFDYCTYIGVITEVECAIATFPYYSEQDKWTEDQLERYKDKISEWETNWSLYGTVELKAKIDTYRQNMDLLSQSAVVRYSITSYAIKPWSNLSQSEKNQYGNLESNYFYDEYQKNYTNYLSASSYYSDLVARLQYLESERDKELENRTLIAKSIKEEYYFTEDEYDLLQMLYRDAEYSNENIFTTSLDTRDDKYDRMLELMEDAKTYISSYSRPQLTFTVSVDNLLGLDEFKALRDSFVVGNFLYIEYRDGMYVKLRMVSMAFNPCVIKTNNLTITFSNFIRSNNGISDLESILGNSSSGGGGSGGSSSGGGAVAEVDDVISNTLLSKLLNSETFGTRVKDVVLNTIDVKKITAKTAEFGGLIEGVTKIDGRCLQTGYIYDWRYNGDLDSGSIENTSGSIINLETGHFNFGGGRLKWNGESLSVDGVITAGAGSKIGGWTLGNRSLYSGEGVGLGITNVAGAVVSPTGISFSNGTPESTFFVYNGQNGFKLNMGGKIDFSNGILNIDGIIKANSGSTIGGFTIGENSIYTDASLTNFSSNIAGVRLSTTGINISDGSGTGTFQAYYNESGFNLNIGNRLTLRNSELTVEGKIIATSGKFGTTSPFDIGDNGITGAYLSNSTSEQSFDTTVDIYNSGNISNNFTVQIVRQNQNNSNKDIVWNIENADAIVTYSYIVTRTISTSVSDDSIIVGDGSEDDGQESYSGGSSGNVVTTQTETIRNTIIIPIALSETITDMVSVSLNGTVKTYSYSRNVTQNGDAKNFIINTIRNNDSSINSETEITIESATISFISNYRYANVTINSHIGTDYFSYSGLIEARGSNVTVSNLIINSNTTTQGNIYLEGQGKFIRGRMASNDFWLIRGGGSNNAGYLEIATADDGTEPIYIRQYTGVYSSIKRTLTLLDGSGNTTLPGELKVNNISTAGASWLNIKSVPIIAQNMYMGSNMSQGLERNIFFRSDGGTYTHYCKLYGGNSNSTTGIGMYDAKNSHGILVYNDKDNILSASGCKYFYFKDYSSTTRMPVASISGDGSRVAAISSTGSNTVKVWGQWGKKGTTYSTRTISTSSSDKRLKENIVDSSVNAISLVDKIKVREFDWKNTNNNKHQIIGFIADELEELDSNLAIGGGYNKNGEMDVKCVDTFYLLGYVVKAIQELKAEIDKLKQK